MTTENVTGTSTTITGLTDGVEYTFTIVANNGLATGAAATATATPSAPTAPGAPTDLVVTASPNELSVAFTAPSANGATITGYTATVSPADVGPTTATESPIVITGLSPGTSYTISLTATNSVGTGPAATTTGIPQDANTAPGEVQDFALTAGDGEITATFTSPVSNGGEAITAYTATVSPATVGPVSESYSPITISGLTDGTEYTVTVTATNSVGTGSGVSGTATPEATTTVPGAPTGVSAMAGDTDAIITFTAPASNGGSAITGYTVTSSPGAITATGTSSPITISGLTDGTAYTFTVTATNAVGTGAASSPSSSVTPASSGGGSYTPAAFVAASAGQEFAGSSVLDLTIPADASIGGTLLLCAVMYDNSGTILTPAGWSLVTGAPFAGSGTYGEQTWMFSKTCAEGDPGGTVAVDRDGGNESGGALVVAYDSSGIDVVGSAGSTSSGVDLVGPSVTTTQANDAVVNFYCTFSSNGATDAVSGTSDTERASFGATNYVGIVVADSVAASAGASTPGTATAPTNAAWSVVTIALKGTTSTGGGGGTTVAYGPNYRDGVAVEFSATSYTVNVTVPSTFEVGDLMFLMIASAYTNVVGDISGGSNNSWNTTYFNQSAYGSGGSARTSIYSRPVAAGDPGAVITINDTGDSHAGFGTSQAGVVALVAYAASSTPTIDVVGQTNDGPGGAPNGGFSDTSPGHGPVLTTTGPNETIVTFVNAYDMSVSDSVGNLRLYKDRTADGGGNASTILIADSQQATAGATTPDSISFASPNSTQVISVALVGAGTGGSGGGSSAPIYRDSSSIGQIGGGSNLSMTIPSSTIAGDLILAAINTFGPGSGSISAPGTPTAPAGFEQVGPSVCYPSNNNMCVNISIFAKTAVAGDAGSTVTFTNTGGERTSAGIVVYETCVVDTSSVGTGAQGESITGATVTTSEAAETVVTIIGAGNLNNQDTITATSPRFNISDSGTATGYSMLAVVDSSQATAGVSAAATATNGSVTTYTDTIAVALKNTTTSGGATDPTAGLTPTNGVLAIYAGSGATSVSPVTKTVDAAGAHFTGTLTDLSNQDAFGLTMPIPAGFTSMTLKAKIPTGTYETLGFMSSGNDGGYNTSFTGVKPIGFGGGGYFQRQSFSSMGDAPVSTSTGSSGPTTLTTDYWLLMDNTGLVSWSTDGVTYTSSGESVPLTSGQTRIGLWFVFQNNDAFEFIVESFEVTTATDPTAALAPAGGTYELLVAGANQGTVTKTVESDGTHLAGTPSAGQAGALNLFQELPTGWASITLKASIVTGTPEFGLYYGSGADGGVASAFNCVGIYSTGDQAYNSLTYTNLGTYGGSHPFGYGTAGPTVADGGFFWLKLDSSGNVSYSEDGTSYATLGTFPDMSTATYGGIWFTGDYTESTTPYEVTIASYTVA